MERPHLQFPIALTPAELVNMVSNPSFEYDAVGKPPMAWSEDLGGGSMTTFEVQDGWAANGKQSLRMTWTNTDPNAPNAGDYPGMHVDGLMLPEGTTDVFVSAAFNFLTNTTGQPASIAINWETAQGDFITQTTLVPTEPTLTTGEGVISGLVAVPNNPLVAQYSVLVFANSYADGDQVDMYFDSLMAVPSDIALPYRDGDMGGYVWRGTPGNSASARARALATVEQNTDEHQNSRVQAVIACPVGWRTDRPEFGWRFPTFANAPLDTESLKSALENFAEVTVESIDEYADAIDASIRHMDVYLKSTGADSGESAP